MSRVSFLNPFIYIYTEFLWRPLFNGLVFFYTALPVQDLGLAIIVLTVAIRILLAPFLWKAQKAQKSLAAIQPEIKKLQERFKNDREGQGKALMELYAERRVNPFSGCLLMAVQLPILIALFQVFQKGFDPAELKYIYSFISNPGALNPTSFGLIDLARGNIYLGIFAAITQYLQTQLASPPAAPAGDKKDFAQMLQWQTKYIFPGLILVWSYTLPSALTLYWTVLNILGIVQEIIMKQIANRRPQMVNTLR